MSWNYFTYIKQPVWFIDALFVKFNLDNNHQNKEQKRANRKR